MNESWKRRSKEVSKIWAVCKAARTITRGVHPGSAPFLMAASRIKSPKRISSKLSKARASLLDLPSNRKTH